MNIYMQKIGNLIPHRLGPIRTPWDQLWLSYGIESYNLPHFWFLFFFHNIEISQNRGRIGRI